MSILLGISLSETEFVQENLGEQLTTRYLGTALLKL